MKPSIIVWDLETVPDLGGFAAANGVAPPLDASYVDTSQPWRDPALT
jgi:hypothetical protein